MKICLVQTPVYGIDFPPIGLAYLKSFVENNGHKVKIFDFNIELFSKVKGRFEDWWSFSKSYFWSYENKLFSIPFLNEGYFDECVEKILQESPNYVGFSVFNSTFISSLIMAKKIKLRNKNIKIIFGGVHIRKDDYYNRDSEEIFKWVDLLVLGEGEEILAEILNNPGKENIAGMILKSDNKIIYNQSHRLIPDLDELPFPSYTDFNLSNYRKGWFPLLTSRGCVNRCIFCEDRNYWKRYRERSAINVIEEIKFIIKRYNVRVFHLNDLAFNVNLRKLEKICDEIISLKFNVMWGGNAFIREDMDETLFKKLFQAGCRWISFGIESASPFVLREMRKPMKIKTIEKCLKLATNTGITTVTNWIIGYPAERFIDFLRDVWFLSKNKKFIKEVFYNTFLVHPRSDFFHIKEKYNVILEKDYDFFNGLCNWTTTDRKNTYKRRLQRQKIFEFFLVLLGLKPIRLL